MSWLAWFHLGKVQEGFGMMRLLVVVKTINCSAVQLLRVISLSHRAAQAGEMKSFPRDSSPLSRLPLTEGQPIGVRGSLFLGVCAIPEDVCRALISADSFGDTDTSPCEATLPQQLLSLGSWGAALRSSLPSLWGFVVPVAVACWCQSLALALCCVPAWALAADQELDRPISKTQHFVCPTPASQSWARLPAEGNVIAPRQWQNPSGQSECAAGMFTTLSCSSSSSPLLVSVPSVRIKKMLLEQW